MKEQFPDDSDFSLSDHDDQLTNDLSDNTSASTIFKKDGINPDKRRRLEALREERELMDDLRDVFDED